jgi:hypothetical protein
MSRVSNSVFPITLAMAANALTFTGGARAQRGRRQVQRGVGPQHLVLPGVQTVFVTEGARTEHAIDKK